MPNDTGEQLLLQNALLRLTHGRSHHGSPCLKLELPMCGMTLDLNLCFALNLSGHEVTIVLNGRTITKPEHGPAFRNICVGFTAVDQRAEGGDWRSYAVNVTWEIKVPETPSLKPGDIEISVNHDDARPETRSDASPETLDERLSYIQERLLEASSGRHS